MKTILKSESYLSQIGGKTISERTLMNFNGETFWVLHNFNLEAKKWDIITLMED